MTKNTAVQKREGVKPKVVAERPHKGLTETQEELAELASDMLMNGGARDDMDSLLFALDQHWYRRGYARSDQSTVEIDKNIEERNRRHGTFVERWYRDLAKIGRRRSRSTSPDENVSRPKGVVKLLPRL